MTKSQIVASHNEGGFTLPAKRLDRRGPTDPVRSDPTWIRPDTVFIDLDPQQLTLARALDACDHGVIWEEYRSAPDQGQYLDWLSTMASSYCTEQRHHQDSSLHYCLIAAPFLVSPEEWDVAKPAEGDRGAAAAMLGQLQSWVGYDQDVSIVLTGVPYMNLCRWSPVTQREQLLALARQPVNSVAPWLAQEAAIAKEFPQLVFLMGSVQRWDTWPNLPEGESASKSEWAFRSRLAAHLAYVLHHPVRPCDVLVPANFREAVFGGLQMWLGELGRRELVRGWQVHAREDDLVLLELLPENPETPASILPIRRHQLPFEALDLLMMELQQEFGPALASEVASS